MVALNSKLTLDLGRIRVVSLSELAKMISNGTMDTMMIPETREEREKYYSQDF